ncbi:MAG TPA: hypothetical protein VGV14_18895 [Rhodanobacter sp.]|nr:hypothetical protein [Rhodanobacter sp.]
MTSTTAAIPPKDRRFDPSRTPTTEESRQCIAEVMQKLSAAEKRRKKRKATDQAIHERALSAIICDLVHRCSIEPTGWLTVELSKAALSKDKRRAPFMTEQFAILVKSLAQPAVDVLELRVGDPHPYTGVRSTIRASEAFRVRVDELGLDIEHFGRDPKLLGDPLELRSAKTKRLVNGKVAFIADKLPLPESDRVTRMRSEMIAINAWIAGASLWWLGDFKADKIDVGQRALKRIFNNGSLDAGGRLYGGFWQAAKSAQRTDSIVIDDQAVASLDFAQSALRMAYAQVGVEPPRGDLYAVWGLEGYRSETKKIVNALLSADTMPRRFPKGTRGEMPKSWKFERVIDYINRYHAPIVSLFGSASGLRFMQDESDILIRTLLRLQSLGIVALPIHDCVLVGWSHRETAKQVMEESFHEVLGVLGVVEVEGRDWRSEMRERVEGDIQGTSGKDDEGDNCSSLALPIVQL